MKQKQKLTYFNSIMPVSLLALTAFLLSAILGWVVASKSEPYPTQGEITDWKFVWTDDAGQLEEPPAAWSLATQNARVYKPLGKSAVRLQTTIPASDQEKTLEIFTSFNAVKIHLDGSELENINYDMGGLSGSRHYRVTIPRQDREAVLDVYVRAPYAFSFRAGLVDGTSAGYSMHDFAQTAPMILGLAVLLCGLFTMIAGVVITSGRHGLILFNLMGTLIMSAGAQIVLSRIGVFVPDLNSPWLFRLQIMLIAAVFTLQCLLTNRLLGRNRAVKIAALTLSVVAVAYAVLPMQPVSNWILPMVAVCKAAAFALLSVQAINAVLDKTRFAKPLLFVTLLFGFTHLYDSVVFLLGVLPNQPAVKYVGIAGYILVLFPRIIHKVLVEEIRHEERHQQVAQDRLWIERIIHMCANIFTQSEVEEFCITTAHSIGQLVRAVDMSDENNQAGSEYLSTCMAMHKNGQYVETYRDGTPSPCEYKAVAHRFKKDGRPVFFGVDYLDIVLQNTEEIVCIIHYEGIAEGLSDNLKNIIHMAYAGLPAVLDNLKLKNDLAETQYRVFLSLAEITQDKSDETGVHLKQVCNLTAVLCQELGLSEHETAVISRASMMHDIGKLAVPEDIISKRGKLTSDEYVIMQDHVIYGYNMMSRSPGELMEAAAVIAKQHHEHYDGSGYLGLAGDQIHFYARVVTVADVFDALMRSRSYKEAWPPDRALQYLNENAGRKFDPQVIDALNRCADKAIAIAGQSE